MLRKLFFILLLLPALAFAQKVDEELAAQFMAEKEYAKAADLYEKLLAKNPKSVYFYDNLFKSYVQLNNLDEAGKLAKKQQRRYEASYYYQVDAAYILQLKNQPQNATLAYQNLINKLIPAEPRVQELANAFLKRGLKEQSVQTYLQGRKLMRSDLLFANELAGLYVDLNQKTNAIDEYLNVLLVDESQQENVQGYLQNYLSEPTDFLLLRNALLKRIKQNAGNEAYNEMLIWYHVQLQDFTGALVYVKALDKKYREQGRRIMELGLLASSNKKYDAAIAILNQVTALGADGPYYAYARNAMVEVRGKKLLDDKYTTSDLQILKSEYRQLIAEFGYVPFMANTIKELARLQAYYLNQPDSAVKTLEKLVNTPRLDAKTIADAKLELGDLYLFKNEVWEAMLLYGQVDNDFKEEPIGREAKFRNARLSYFIGEFDWARIQLDVLKTATTQLIANNAIELSLLIQDNTVDSNEEPLAIYARADLYFYRQQFGQAMQTLDSLESLYPKHELADDILYKRAQIYVKQKDYANAIKFYNMVHKEHGSGIFGDNALFELVQIHLNYLQDKATATKLCEQFIDQYSGSFYLTEIRKIYRRLRGDEIN